ncbi:hypothetical protein M2G39_22625, partial [Vibrio vulnificus]|nr:hypothetical protein [Vibrio vulnificus]
ALGIKWKYINRGYIMTLPKCPKCETFEYVVLVNTGEVVGTATGAVAGAASGAAAGAAIGSFFPGLGTAIGAAAGGLIGALTEGAAGAAVGNKVGEQIDKARKTYKCNKCSSEIDG